jgi:hypothetical protein
MLALMDVNRALDQIAEIHAHLARTETYRGYRALPLALTGVLAILGAILQSQFVPVGAARVYLLYWLAVAAAAAGVAGIGVVMNHLAHHRGDGWGRTVEVVGQFVPCLAAGALLTGLLAPRADLISLLPGIWAVLFSLGLFASRPFLPRLIGWIGLLYFIAGAQLLVLARTGASLAPWGMGITFGAGQLLTAGVFYWNLERKIHDETR